MLETADFEYEHIILQYHSFKQLLFRITSVFLYSVVYSRGNIIYLLGAVSKSDRGGGSYGTIYVYCP